MDQKRLETIVYAEGYLEDFIEDFTNVGDLPMDAEELEHRKQILNMWQVLSTGLADLRRENTDFSMKIAVAFQALVG